MGGQTTPLTAEYPAQRGTSTSPLAAGDLPLLQVCHISALEGSFQEVGELVVNWVIAFQMPGRGVICDLGKGTEREPWS